MILRSCVISSVLLVVGVSVSLGAEVREYRFVGDVPAYRGSCGECFGVPYERRSRVEGTFQVELDPELGVGTLLSLDARLTGSEGLFGDGLWRPFGSDRAFLRTSSWYDRYRPPFGGMLAPAQYRPLGPDTLTSEHLAESATELSPGVMAVRWSDLPDPLNDWSLHGIGFEPAPINSWMLLFEGTLPKPDGRSAAVVADYSIYFEGSEAIFSYNLPIIDATESIVAARAVLVPEPATIGLEMGCIAMGWALLRRRRNAHGRPR
jgi:hypothetical protein